MAAKEELETQLELIRFVEEAFEELVCSIEVRDGVYTIKTASLTLILDRTLAKKIWKK
jgi:hypothetical protein